MTGMAERNIDYWVRRLILEDMPLFSRTVQHVAGMANKDNCSYSELAWSILEDPALTSRVLKLANSMYYNPYSKRITTVSRAVMRLGTNAIREICLAISLIESVLSGLHKGKVAFEVARSFHAAVQAQKLAVRLKLPDPEEVFIAALLARIGHIAFWCFAGSVGARLENAMVEAARDELAELDILGFKLERLSERLSEEWKLSELLERALRDRNDADPRVRTIKLGCAVAMASEKGWDSPEIGRTIREVSNFSHVPVNEVTEMLHQAAREAAEVTEFYGTSIISRLVPIPGEIFSEKSVQAGKSDIAAEISKAGETEKSDLARERYPKPDPSIQLASLRDLSTLMTSGGGEFNMMLSIVLEGIYRGIGMDRVVFALLSPDRKYLQGKHGLGCIEADWIQKFRIGVGPEVPNIIGCVLKNRKPVWVSEKPEASVRQLLTQELVSVIGGGPYFLMPVSIKEVAIGVIYADRKSSGRKLDDESFEKFTWFGQQTNLGLSVLVGD
jgi:HD-like signal output (HDOD) protein